MDCTGSTRPLPWRGQIVLMHGDENAYGCSPSTTWAFKRVKMRSAPQAKGSGRRRRSPLSGLPPHPPRSPLSVTVVYRGGAECWIELRSRGRVVRRPGSVALYDVLREIWRLD